MTRRPSAGHHSWIESATALFRRLPASIALAIEGWRERHALACEMARLRMQGDLERTLADSGVAPSDVPRLIRAHPGAARQFGDMAERVGIDRARLPLAPAIGAAFRDMGLRCGDCTVWRHCRAWLDSGLLTDGYRDFCPNAEALELLRDQQRPAQPDRPQSPPSGILAELGTSAGQYL